MRSWVVSKIAKGLVILVVAMTVLGAGTMLLWNALIPEMFHGPALTFWQALGLLVLAHIMVRGWSPWYGRPDWRHDRWRQKMHEKFSRMSPEERENVRAEFRRKCGWDLDEEKSDRSAAGA
jgi:hypothetical protein